VRSGDPVTPRIWPDEQRAPAEPERGSQSYFLSRRFPTVGPTPCSAKVLRLLSLRFLSSSRRMVRRWTSSGPSMKRSARGPKVYEGHGVSVGKPAGAEPASRGRELRLDARVRHDFESRDLGARGIVAVLCPSSQAASQARAAGLVDLHAPLGDPVLDIGVSARCGRRPFRSQRALDIS